MAAYYNEHDRFAAAWLRELIAAGEIAPGEVDERDIRDVLPSELVSYEQCHFFAGVGVWSYALRLAGVSDSETVWTGSCPCQPFSQAGARVGFADERHLWPAFHHLISQLRPPEVFGEQVADAPALEWFDLVSADMEAAGYAIGAADLCAASVGAPHERQRLFWVAYTPGARRWGRPALAAGRDEEPGGSGPHVRAYPWPDGFGSGSTLPVSDVLSASYGSPGRVGRLRGYGNAINAEVAAAFIAEARAAIDDIRSAA